MAFIGPPPDVWTVVGFIVSFGVVFGIVYGYACFTPAERMARQKRRTRQREVDAMIAEAIGDIIERYPEVYDPADCILVEDGKWVR